MSFPPPSEAEVAVAYVCGLRFNAPSDERRRLAQAFDGESGAPVYSAILDEAEKGEGVHVYACYNKWPLDRFPELVDAVDICLQRVQKRHALIYFLRGGIPHVYIRSTDPLINAGNVAQMLFNSHGDPSVASAVLNFAECTLRP